MLFGFWNNHIENNDIQAYGGHPITLMNNSCNNVFLGNTLIGIDPNAPCTGFRLVYSPNNLIANNTIQNFRAHVLLTGSNNCIVANNSISISRGNQMANQCGIILYRANNNIIINNDVSSIVAAGIRLMGYSKRNTIKGNMINDAGLSGIELYYESDENTLSDNDVSGCSFGIILDEVSGNEIYRNNFTNNEQNGFDDGSNTWVRNGIGNYWGDYEGADNNNDGSGDMQYEITPRGVDDNPLINKVEVTPAEIPGLEETAYVSPSMPEIISNHEIWEERTIELSNPFQILEGASLTLRNVDLRVNYDGNSLFVVEPGGSLEISNSRIIAYGQQIQIKEGALFKVEGSELYGLGHWDGGGGLYVECDEAVINNNVIQGGYAAICLKGSMYHQITGNSIFNCGFGITFLFGDPYGNNLIENNDIFDIIGEGIFGSLHNSVITGNTFRDIWGHPISLWSATGNTIYNNNFIECGAPLEEGKDNVWYYGNTGNHWSDYQEKYPDAWEHAEYTCIWYTPYVILGENSQDLYPIMPSAPLVRTGEVTDVTEDSARLNSDFMVGDVDSVRVFFEYCVDNDTRWQNTDPKTYMESGVHSEELSGLKSDYAYTYRTILQYNDLTLYGGEKLVRTQKSKPPAIMEENEQTPESPTSTETTTPAKAMPEEELTESVDRSITLALGITASVIVTGLFIWFFIRRKVS